MPGAAGAAAKGAVSVWRSGSITPIFAQAWNEFTSPPPDQTVPQSFTYTSTAPVWSPDGRYLALPLSAGVRLPGGANAFPTVACADNLAMVCQSAPVAAPNKGFSAALAAAEAGWSPAPQMPPQWNSQEIAWRADGQELATMLPGQDFNTGKYTATVTIFNASTGVVVKTLAINRTAVDYYGYSETPQIAWSPRGSSFAALNYADATLILWRAE
jgi:hypothetical protein